MFFFCSNEYNNQEGEHQTERPPMPDKPTRPKQDQSKQSTILPENAASTPMPSISIDWDFYAEFLKDVNMSDDERLEFLQALVSIVIGFVDLGFNVHPAQLATKDAIEKKQTCESIVDTAPSSAPDVLNSVHANKESEKCIETARSE